jgi:hypothetical protein
MIDIDDPRFIYGNKPFEYQGLLIYPVTMDKHMEFYTCINCLLLEKNREPDIRIIKMSYLDYLFEISKRDEKNKIFIEWLQYLILVVFKDCKTYDFYYDEQGKIFFKINDTTLYSNDFDNIREIILKQNGIEYEEMLLDFEFEKALAEASEHKAKHSDKPANLEERMTSYHIYNGLEYEKIYNLTIRQFNKGLERMSLKTNYEIYKSAELSGMVTFKEDIQYWLSHIGKKDKFDGLVVKDADETIGKIKSALQ